MLEGIQSMIGESSKLLKDDKRNYLTKAVSYHSPDIKKYWSLINKILSKSKILEMRPVFGGWRLCIGLHLKVSNVQWLICSSMYSIKY